MATIGKITSYDLTVGLYLDIEGMISILSPFDVPLQGGSGADGRSALSTGSVFEKKYEWQDETLLTPRSTLGAAWNSTTTTVLTVAAGDQARFSTGDILLVDKEYVRVAAYGVTNDTLLVTRTYAGTNDTHASAAVVVGVGTALAEGSDPENARAVDRTNRYNVTQIFGPTAIQTSGTENVIKKYGIEGTGEFNKQVANRTKEHFIARDQALVYGQRVEDGSNKWRSFGGLDYWITTNNDTTTTSISESALLNQLQTCYDAGGSPDRLLVGSTQKRKFSALSNGITVNEARTANERGQVVDFFDSDFGRVSILLDRWVRAQDAFLFEREQATIETLRPLVFEMLAKTGDSLKGQIVSEIGMRFRRQGHAAKFTALT